MRCIDDADWLAYSAGALDPAAAARVREHLDGCIDCRRARAQTADTRACDPLPPAGGPPSPALSSGSAVGRYRILEAVGAGGMSTVYAAYDPDLDRKIALKLLRGGASAERWRTRLQREAQAMARVTHPNVVTVHDVGVSADGKVYIAMEYVDGGTLRSWLRSSRPTTAEIVARYTQAAKGLAAAHRAGLVHRDFKPDNVLVGRDGRLRVTDFGLVRTAEDGSRSDEPPPPDAAAETGAAAEPGAAIAPRPDAPAGLFATPLTELGSVMGTPGYMAPEQYRGDVVDARTDQFCFCIALFEALTGRLPFNGDSLVEIGASAASGRIVDSAELAKLPARLRRILQRGLMVERAHRYPSMEQLIHDLEHDPAQRRRQLAAAGALLALTAAAVVTAARRAPAPCRDGEAQMATVWNDEARARLAGAFARSAWPYAAEAARMTSAALDSYARRWTGLHQELCEAARVRHTASDEDLRVEDACLDQRRGEMQALVHLLGDADNAMVSKATQAAGDLTSVEMCSDPARVAAAQALPVAPGARQEALAIRAGLAQVKANSDLARDDAADQQAAALWPRAQKLAFAPVLSETALQLGVLAHYRHRNDDVIRYAKQSWSAAEGAGLEEVKVRAAQLIARNAAEKRQFDLAHDWMTIARATSARVADAAHLEPMLDSAEGWLLDRQGHHQEAVPLLRKALAGAEAAHDEHIDVAQFENRLAAALQNLGQNDEAMVHYRRAIELTNRRLGPGHDTVFLINLGGMLSDMRRFDESASLLARAVADRERGIGGDPLLFTIAYGNYAQALTGLHRLDEAEKAADRSIELARQIDGGKHWAVGAGYMYRGMIAVERGRLDDARRELRQALAGLEATLPKDHDYIADALVWAADVEYRDGHPERVREPLERALAIYDKEGIATELAARGHFLLAQTLAAAPSRTPSAGKPSASPDSLARTALAQYAQLHMEAQARAVGAWLARH